MMRCLLTVIVILPLSIILGIVSLFVLFVASNTLANNRIISEYYTRFQELIHPENTSKIYSFDHVMPPPGNGDNCFYFVGQIRKYSGSQSNIESFYSKEGVSSEFMNNGEFRFEFATNGEFSQVVPYGFNDLSNLPIEDLLDSERKIYIIYWLIPDYLITSHRTTIWDLRCG